MFAILRWSVAGLLLVSLVAVLYLELSMRRALDTQRAYSAAVAELPFFDGSDGISQLRVDGATFRVRIAGFDANPGAPVVVLLHGFPVNSAMWLPILQSLADAGYRVIAPDQRGYSPGARPDAVSDYRVELLAQDVLLLVDAIGVQQFHLVGHDWGAIVGWRLASTAQERLLSWSALSIPHPAALADAIASDPEQRSRSGYIRLLRLPWLPEVVLARDNFASLQALGESAGEVQHREYVALFSEPGAATAAFNWYRALPASLGDVMAGAPHVAVSTLFIGGSVDGVVAPSSVAAQSRYLIGPYREVSLRAGHRLVQSHSREVTNALLAHFRATQRSASAGLEGDTAQ
ncbi:MAG: alpha/beta hydrolase [Halioglobus sp.]|nr:alpha/beta hydrolase [Halioglobus sp.]